MTKTATATATKATTNKSAKIVAPTPEVRRGATKEARAAIAAEAKAVAKAEADTKKAEELAANPKPERKPRESKFTSPVDQLALKIVDKIRDDRESFVPEAVVLSESGDSSTHSFFSKIGAAMVHIGRVESAGKKSREIIGRAFIMVKPEVGKHLEITGPLAARAWYALNHEPKGHGKTAPDEETIDAAAAALGL